MYDSASTQNPKKEGVFGVGGIGVTRGWVGRGLWVEIKYVSIGGF